MNSRNSGKSPWRTNPFLFFLLYFCPRTTSIICQWNLSTNISVSIKVRVPISGYISSENVSKWREDANWSGREWDQRVVKQMRWSKLPRRTCHFLQLLVGELKPTTISILLCVHSSKAHLHICTFNFPLTSLGNSFASQFKPDGLIYRCLKQDDSPHSLIFLNIPATCLPFFKFLLYLHVKSPFLPIFKIVLSQESNYYNPTCPLCHPIYFQAFKY